MNFLAHYVIATRYFSPADALPAYVVGTALPDLLSLAAPRCRLRPALLANLSTGAADDAALRAGAAVHLATDTAFHRTAAFAGAQVLAGRILQQTPFEGIRVRRFFVAHVLVEMALDAVLLRADTSLADDFYQAFGNADFAAVTRWTEAVVARSLPTLPAVLSRFARSRYLYRYGEDEGVATGLSRVCARARQDTFEGQNHARLVAVVRKTVAALEERVEDILRETAATLQDALLREIPARGMKMSTITELLA